MSNKQKTQYVAKNGHKVTVDINNTQKHDRPSKYFLIDADLCSDVLTARNLDSGTADEVLNFLIGKALKTLKIDDVSLCVEDYNFSTSFMTTNIRNVGIHENQKALYDAMMKPKTKPTVTAIPKATPKETVIEETVLTETLKVPALAVADTNKVVDIQTHIKRIKKALDSGKVTAENFDERLKAYVLQVSENENEVNLSNENITTLKNAFPIKKPTVTEPEF